MSKIKSIPNSTHLKKIHITRDTTPLLKGPGSQYKKIATALKGERFDLIRIERGSSQKTVNKNDVFNGILNFRLLKFLSLNTNGQLMDRQESQSNNLELNKHQIIQLLNTDDSFVKRQQTQQKSINNTFTFNISSNT